MQNFFKIKDKKQEFYTHETLSKYLMQSTLYNLTNFLRKMIFLLLLN